MIHNSKIVHPRKISLVEVRGNESFIKIKVVSNFHFEHFLGKKLQCHLVAKWFKKIFGLWPEMFTGIKSMVVYFYSLWCVPANSELYGSCLSESLNIGFIDLFFHSM